jgi:hypothetical protein
MGGGKPPPIFRQNGLSFLLCYDIINADKVLRMGDPGEEPIRKHPEREA